MQKNRSIKSKGKKIIALLKKLAHIFGGFLTGLLSVSNPVLAVIFFIAFLVYEMDEEKVLGDACFEELREFMYGIVIFILLAVGMY